MRLTIVAKLLLTITGIVLLTALTCRFIGFSWEDGIFAGMCVLGGICVLLVAATVFMVVSEKGEL